MVVENIVIKLTEIIESFTSLSPSFRDINRLHTFRRLFESLLNWQFSQKKLKFKCQI